MDNSSATYICFSYKNNCLYYISQYVLYYVPQEVQYCTYNNITVHLKNISLLKLTASMQEASPSLQPSYILHFCTLGRLQLKFSPFLDDTPSQQRAKKCSNLVLLFQDIKGHLLHHQCDPRNKRAAISCLFKYILRKIADLLTSLPTGM